MSASVGSTGRASKSSQSILGSPNGTNAPMVRFENIDEAMEFVGAENVINVDFESPESHQGPLFFLYLAPNCKNEKRTALRDLVRIYLPTIFDLRDLSRISGRNVCGGRGFMISLPSAASFLLEDFEFLHDLDPKTDEVSKESHATLANVIAKNEERRVAHYLFVMPEDVVCNAVLDDNLPPTVDQSIRIKMRNVELDTLVTLGEGKRTKSFNQLQQFQPGYFELRICEEEERIIRLSEDTTTADDLADYFEGTLRFDDSIDDDEMFGNGS